RVVDADGVLHTASEPDFGGFDFKAGALIETLDDEQRGLTHGMLSGMVQESGDSRPSRETRTRTHIIPIRARVSSDSAEKHRVHIRPRLNARPAGNQRFDRLHKIGKLKRLLEIQPFD